MTIANRDTEGYCFKLEFDPEKCKWVFVCNADDAEIEVDKSADEKDEWLCMLIDDFLKEESWSGTATELCDALKSIDGSFTVTHLNIKKKLKANMTALKEDFNIGFDDDRNRGSRTIILTRHNEQLCL